MSASTIVYVNEKAPAEVIFHMDNNPSTNSIELEKPRPISEAMNNDKPSVTITNQDSVNVSLALSSGPSNNANVIDQSKIIVNQLLEKYNILKLLLSSQSNTSLSDINDKNIPQADFLLFIQNINNQFLLNILKKDSKAYKLINKDNAYEKEQEQENSLKINMNGDTLALQNIHYTLNSINYLNDVSFYIKPSELVGLIGAPDSGTNKTLDIAAGRIYDNGGTNSNLKGQILYNGRPRTQNDTRNIGYVVKEDPNFPELTVYETLLFAARLRVSPSEDYLTSHYRVLIIMKLFGLTHARNTVVGNELIRGVSGGERRRVSIACEFIAGHKICLADLPTNGLDSPSAFSLISNIRELLTGGNSFMCSIVQPAPELLDLFDSIILMSKGTIIYQGPPNKAEEYLNAQKFFRPPEKSLPDWLEELSACPERYYSETSKLIIDPAKLKVLEEYNLQSSQNNQSLFSFFNKKNNITLPYDCTIRGLVWNELRNHYNNSNSKRLIENKIQEIKNENKQMDEASIKFNVNQKSLSRYASSYFKQFAIVFDRQLTLMKRKPQAWIAVWGQIIFVSLVLGSLFYQIPRGQEDVRTRFGLFFYMMMGTCMPVNHMIPVHFSERLTFFNQKRNGYYHPALYHLSSLLVQFPISLIEWGLAVIIVYPMSGLYGGLGSEWSSYLWLVAVMSNMVSRAYIMLLVALSKNETVAIVLHPATMLIFFTTCGFTTPAHSIPAGWQWAHTASYLTYVIRSLEINEHQHSDFIFSCNNNDLSCAYHTGSDALSLYDMNDDLNVRWLNAIVLMIYFIVFALGSMLLYVYIDWNEREFGEAPNYINLEEMVRIKYEQQHGKSEIAAAAGGQGKSLLNQEFQSFIEWNQLDYEVDVPDETNKKNTKSIKLLNKTFGFAKPKMMVALMGASGAGKTTLLDVLAGRKTSGRISGSIKVNGIEKNPTQFSRIAAYVEQFDSHNPNSTIREAIEFSSRLRLRKSLSVRERNKKINHIMNILGLTHLQDQLIGVVGAGGVSPEIRKKVTIAVELVMDPTILFCDEPTTGLDSPGALSVMRAVKDLASEIAVVCTIHQPSAEIVNMFDYLLLMKPGGQIAYFGPLASLANYFKINHLGDFNNHTSNNLGDFALTCIKNSLATGTDTMNNNIDLAQTYLNSELGQSMVNIINYDPNNNNNNNNNTVSHGVVPKELIGKLPVVNESDYPTELIQFSSLVKRFFISSIRNTEGLLARFVTTIITAFISSTIFNQLGDDQTAATNRVALCFLATLLLNFSATVLQPTQFAARPVYFRESTSNMYSAGVYVLSRFIADLPFVILEVFCFVSIIYFVTGLTLSNAGIHFALFFAVLLGARLVAISWNNVTSALVPVAEGATGLFTVMLIVNLLFTGFLIRRDRIPTGWIFMYYLDFLRYSVNFLAANELRDTQSFTCDLSALYPAPTHYSTNGACVLNNQLLNYNGSHGVLADGYKCPLQCGVEVLDVFGLQYGESDMYSNFFALFIFVIGFQFITFLLQKYINHIKR